MLTSVDRRSGELKANELVRYEAGSRTHDSGFTDLVVREKGAYIATGFVRVPLGPPLPGRHRPRQQDSR